MKPQLEQRFVLLGGITTVGRVQTPVTEDEVRSRESDLGVSFPPDYRDLLKTHGAASFGKLVEFRTASRKAPFSYFLGSNAGTQSLAKRVKTYSGRMPNTMIPSGDDGGGNLICLGIKDDETEKIYYWDRNDAWD